MFRKLKKQLSCIECSSLKAEDIYRESVKKERMGRAHSRPGSMDSTRSRSSSLPASSRSNSLQGYNTRQENYQFDDLSMGRQRRLSGNKGGSMDNAYRRDQPQQPVHHQQRRAQLQQSQQYEEQQHKLQQIQHQHNHQQQLQDERRRQDSEQQQPSNLEESYDRSRLLRQNPGRRIRTRPNSNSTRRSFASAPIESVPIDQPSEHDVCNTNNIENTTNKRVSPDTVDGKESFCIVRNNSDPVLKSEESRLRSVSFAGPSENNNSRLFRRRRSISLSEGDGPLLPGGVSLSGDGMSRSLVSIVNQEWQSQTQLDSASCSTGSQKRVKSILKQKTNSLDNSQDAHEQRKRVNSVTFADMRTDSPMVSNRRSYPSVNQSKKECKKFITSNKENSSNQNRSVQSFDEDRLRYKPPLPRGSRSTQGLKDQADNKASASQPKHLWRPQGSPTNISQNPQQGSPIVSHKAGLRTSSPMSQPMFHLGEPIGQPISSLDNISNSLDTEIKPMSAQDRIIPDESLVDSRRSRTLANPSPTGNAHSPVEQINEDQPMTKSLMRQRRLIRSSSLDSDNCSSSTSSGASGESSKPQSSIETNTSKTESSIPRIKKGQSASRRTRRSLSATRKLVRHDSADSGLCMDMNISPPASDPDVVESEDKRKELRETKPTVPNRNLKYKQDTGSNKTKYYSSETSDSCRTPMNNDLSTAFEDLNQALLSEELLKPISRLDTSAQHNPLTTSLSKPQKNLTNCSPELLRSVKSCAKQKPRESCSGQLKATNKVSSQVKPGNVLTKRSSIPVKRNSIRRSSMDNMLNISMTSMKSEDNTRTENTAPPADNRSSTDDSQEPLPHKDVEFMANESVDWTLTAEDLPEATIETLSTPDFSEIEISCGDNSMMSYMNKNDCSRVVVPRACIRTGKLMMKDDNSGFCICSGSFQSPKVLKRGPPRCKPITVQIYKGLNDKEDRINLLKNTTVLLQLQHPHILSVYGMCMEGSPHTRDDREVMVLLERTHYLVTLQKLLTWTSENNPELMSVSCAVTFALQMCDGLEFLEKRGIIHANLSSNTIRIDRDCNLKLGGIEQFPVSSTAAPIRWMSLETLSRGQIIPKSAVWTFAVILWETLSVGARPYQQLKTGQILNQLTKGHRLSRPKICPEFLYHLMLHCWQPRPDDRPSFQMLTQSLKEFQSNTPPSSRSPAELFPDREDFWEIVQEHV